jgi:hypothetical protein
MFFQGWLGGTLPATDAVFARLPATMGAEFTLISPSGEIAAREPLLRQLRAAYASRLWMHRLHRHHRCWAMHDHRCHRPHRDRRWRCVGADWHIRPPRPHRPPR